MKRQQILLVSGAMALLIILFFFGRTIPNQKSAAPEGAVTEHSSGDGHDHTPALDIQAVLAGNMQRLTPERQTYLTSLQSAVVRGDVKDQQIHVYHQLASFWKDSASSIPLYIYYTAEASKLENSKKSLTFAARLFLENVRGEEDPGTKTWMAGEGKKLFEKLLELDPSNDSAKVALGSCYIFGAPAEEPQQVMQGIQKILEVARRDSTNMYAQLMLGIGGIVSGQLDKATERLEKVVRYEPENLEAILMLADAYERRGDKVNAIKWYTAGKKYLANPQILEEIERRIKSLQ
ncbi:MAG: tetratricopeptide repeat protein [Chitinophagaceae bacterium]|nr:tetratricopeptide repeat protein [Chitinophagaceae bacterium]